MNSNTAGTAGTACTARTAATAAIAGIAGRPVSQSSACSLQVQAATGQTAAAAAAVAAVVATEAKWDCNGVSQDSHSFTPSELAEEIADGRLQPLQDVIPLSHAGIPRSAGDVVQAWKAALDYAHQQAKLAGELWWSCVWWV